MMRQSALYRQQDIEASRNDWLRFGGNKWWLQVPGDTDLDEGDWRTIETSVVTDAPKSSFDPVGTIGGWAS